MLVHICWSKPKGRQLCDALHEWLPRVLPNVEPWSVDESQRRAQPDPEIIAKLDASRLAIVCVTRENLTDPWLLFDAGAVARIHIAAMRLLLLDLSPGELTGPLAEYPAGQTANRADMYRLVEELAAQLEETKEPIDTREAIENRFAERWTDFRERLDAAPVERRAHDPEPAAAGLPPRRVTPQAIRRLDNYGALSEELSLLRKWTDRLATELRVQKSSGDERGKLTKELATAEQRLHDLENNWWQFQQRHELEVGQSGNFLHNLEFALSRVRRLSGQFVQTPPGDPPT